MIALGQIQTSPSSGGGGGQLQSWYRTVVQNAIGHTQLKLVRGKMSVLAVVVGLTHLGTTQRRVQAASFEDKTEIRY